MDWQPIETIPDEYKVEGRHVLIGDADNKYVAEARFIDGGWWMANNDPSDHWGSQRYPTHWMPLPPPPHREGE